MKRSPPSDLEKYHARRGSRARKRSRSVKSEVTRSSRAWRPCLAGSPPGTHVRREGRTECRNR
ncbi:hypothetical protein D187_001162 [Cystobacter fuscus DSM 2262]|uniref:Uncharacterized protein n=1 Tax=Cystobacter fuscus (strain ATCC 25194 / DSM 2262 / NBRC 100088 / M29) TaxID=1242864 RepID=S9QJA8_CYSF2|nr:hypothetical protein D187_001162 [Cystobacter fuscus DSM 2262]